MRDKNKLIKLTMITIIVIVILVITNSRLKKNTSNTENEKKTTEVVEEVTTEDIEKAVEGKGNFQVYQDEDGNTTGYNMGYLADMPEDNYKETDFEKEVEAGYEYIKAGEYYDDTLGISNSEILYKDVVSMINKMYKEYEASTYKICEIPENQEDTTSGLVYIISLDYDYYILTYYDGEGVTALHDDTAYYASIYSEETNETEDEEWVDEGYDEALVEENIIKDDWLYSNNN